MFRYICKNKECSNYNQKVTKSTIVNVVNEKNIFNEDSYNICTTCGKVIKPVKKRKF